MEDDLKSVHEEDVVEDVWDYVTRLARALVYWNDPQPDTELGTLVRADPAFGVSDIRPRFLQLYADLFDRLAGPALRRIARGRVGYSSFALCFPGAWSWQAAGRLPPPSFLVSNNVHAYSVGWIIMHL